jgi:hypothetical protein
MCSDRLSSVTKPYGRSVSARNVLEISMVVPVRSFVRFVCFVLFVLFVLFCVFASPIAKSIRFKGSRQINVAPKTQNVGVTHARAGNRVGVSEQTK